MQKSPPRVLMASRRLIEPKVSWASAYEFEDTVSAIDGVEQAAVKAIEVKPSRLESRFLSRLQQTAGITAQREPRWDKMAVKGTYDLFFVRAMTPQKLDFLQAIDGWRERCQTAVCWIEELWVDWLQYRKSLKPLRQFDHVFVSHVATADPLSEIIDRPCSFLAPAVDALRFCPYPNPPARSIDMWAMGRRAPATHRRLIEHAKKNEGFMYFYDSARWVYFVEGATEHRELTASLLKRSRYFLTDRAKADEPGQTKGQQVFGPRFFEGAAAGAMLIGEPPDCRVFDEYFDWPDAVIPMPHGSTKIVELIEELNSDPERVNRARCANVVNALRRHDWVHRWETVLDTLGLPATPAAAERKAELERRAAAIESAGSL